MTVYTSADYCYLLLVFVSVLEQSRKGDACTASQAEGCSIWDLMHGPRVIRDEGRTRVPHGQHVSLALGVPPYEGLVVGYPGGCTTPIDAHRHCPNPLGVQNGQSSFCESWHVPLHIALHALHACHCRVLLLFVDLLVDHNMLQPQLISGLRCTL